MAFDDHCQELINDIYVYYVPRGMSYYSTCISQLSIDYTSMKTQGTGSHYTFSLIVVLFIVYTSMQLLQIIFTNIQLILYLRYNSNMSRPFTPLCACILGILVCNAWHISTHHSG